MHAHYKNTLISTINYLVNSPGAHGQARVQNFPIFAFFPANLQLTINVYQAAKHGRLRLPAFSHTLLLTLP